MPFSKWELSVKQIAKAGKPLGRDYSELDIRSIILISEDKQTNKEYMAVRETYISRILSALSMV